MEKIYNKLVRDNIPEIIRSNKEEPVIRILSEQEYKEELERKVFEEYQEVLQATNSSERIEELADMLELLEALALLENKTIEDIQEVARTKKLKRGGFSKRIYLEKVITSKDA